MDQEIREHSFVIIFFFSAAELRLGGSVPATGGSETSRAGVRGARPGAQDGRATAALGLHSRPSLRAQPQRGHRDSHGP